VVAVKSTGTVPGKSDEYLRLFDTGDGRPLGDLPAPPQVAFSPDGRTLAAASVFDAKTVQVWDVPPRKEIAFLYPVALMVALLLAGLAGWQVRRLCA
jgi:hypothetical protein